MLRYVDPDAYALREWHVDPDAFAPASSTPGSPPIGAQGQIAFHSDRDGDFQIYVTNADGTGLNRLTDDPAEDVGPTWSPDGTMIAFASDRDGNFEIYVIERRRDRSGAAYRRFGQ